jgi:ubiquitin-like protein Pup
MSFINREPRREDMPTPDERGLHIGVFGVWGADAGRQQIKRSDSSKATDATVEAPPADTKKSEELKAELDDLLDEIDEVLEENAEEFVRSYVQKGGE